MNTDLIYVDYEALEQIAARFGRQAQEIDQMLQAIRRSKGSLENGGWVGEGADSFFAEMDSDVTPAVERLQQALDEADVVTRRISQLWRQSDEEAAGPLKPGGGGIGAGMGVIGGGADGSPPWNVVPAPGEIDGVGIGIGIGVGVGGGAPGADYTVPEDWLAEVTDGLDGGAPAPGDYAVPEDWLAEVTEGVGGEGGAAAGGGSSGGSSGGGAAGGAPGAAAMESGGGAATTGSGGGSGGATPEASIRDPYGSGAGRDFQRVEAAVTAPGTAAGGGFRFQSLSGGGGFSAAAGGAPAAAAPAASPATGGETAASGGSGMPFGVALASPFVALLGKAVKGKIDEE